MKICFHGGPKEAVTSSYLSRVKKGLIEAAMLEM